MIMILIVSILSFLILILYSCVHISTVYDDHTDDLQQELFLRSYRRTHA